VLGCCSRYSRFLMTWNTHFCFSNSNTFICWMFFQLSPFIICFELTGCYSPAECQLPLLNSRTYNIAIETSCYTCSYHRLIREHERELIGRMKKMNPGFKRNSMICYLPTRSKTTKNNDHQDKQRIYEFDNRKESDSLFKNKARKP